MHGEAVGMRWNNELRALLTPTIWSLEKVRVVSEAGIWSRLPKVRFGFRADARFAPGQEYLARPDRSSNPCFRRKCAKFAVRTANFRTHPARRFHPSQLSPQAYPRPRSLVPTWVHDDSGRLELRFTAVRTEHKPNRSLLHVVRLSSVVVHPGLHFHGSHRRLTSKSFSLASSRILSFSFGT